MKARQAWYLFRERGSERKHKEEQVDSHTATGFDQIFGERK